jgi:nitrite reductase (NO-forming)
MTIPVRPATRPTGPPPAPPAGQGPRRSWHLPVVALSAGGLLVAMSGALTVPTVVPALGWALVVASVLMFLGLVIGRPVRPGSTRPALSGVALGLVMTLVPVALAVCGEDAPTGPASVSLHGADRVQEVAVSLVSMHIRPGVIEVPAGTRLRLVVTNHDGMPHDLAFSDGRATPMLAGDRSATLNLGTLTTNRSGWCTVPGHREAGMTLDIRVTGYGAAAGSTKGYQP